MPVIRYFMRFVSNRRKIWQIGVIGIAIVGIGLGIRSGGHDLATWKFVPLPELPSPREGELPGYIQLAAERQTAGSAVFGMPGVIAIQAADWSDVSAEADLETKTANGITYMNWLNEEGFIEWNFEVGQAGDYELELTYAPIAGGSGSIVRGIELDGAYPYAEAQTIRWDRYWSDAKFPYATNAIGNQIRPGQREALSWRTVRAHDYAVSPEPLKFRLTAGNHRLRMTAVSEPVALRTVRFVPAASIPSYSEYEAGHRDDSLASSWSHRIEAEQFTLKSPIGLQTQPFAEPHISPDPKGRLVYNTIGGDSWKEPGDWAEWQVEVPKSGWYRIDVKYMQSFIGHIGVFRTLSINGEVPFREALAYRFSYAPQFRLETLSSPSGQAYRFWLNQGTNTIRMTADASAHEPISEILKHIETELRQVDRDIRKITGNYGFAAAESQDANRSWKLDAYFPDLSDRLRAYHRDLSAVAAAIDSMHGMRTQPGTTLAVAASVLQKLMNQINDLPYRLTDLDFIRNSLGDVAAGLSKQPLLIDYLIVRSEDAPAPKHRIKISERIKYTLVQFARSFYLPYDTKSLNRDETLVVWLQRGRDYANLLQDLIDRDFTPATGIPVNINIMPNPSVLLMGNLAGDQPDVALGVSMETTVDFAMRGAVSELSGLEGYKRLVEQFHPGVMRAFTYRSGVYAFPETQSFQVLFYRRDLLEQMGLRLPDTWEDVYALLPDLMENGMHFYYPPKWFEPFFYQRDLAFYTDDGLYSRLREPASLPAFQQWVDLFRKHDLPKDVPTFFNHFKDGDLPIGIADFNTYVQLLVAAPEIARLWEIAPLPGIPNKDGVVERWAPQAASAAMIMKNSGKQEQAWQFLQWWLTEETQAAYGREIEAIKGLEYRWNTANQEALFRLPWPKAHIDVIREQNKWVRNVPYVPGHYYLPRLMDFAWNRVVLEGDTPKEALEKSALSLEREMQRKQRELPAFEDRKGGRP